MPRKHKLRKLSMTINEYAEAILPIIKLCLKEKANNPTSYKSSHLWYIYRQAFYGFTEFIDWKSRCRVSVDAMAEYKKIDPFGDLRNRKWYEQKDFDSGIQKGKFHLEHIFTGDMFRDAIESLSAELLTVDRLVDIVRDHYSVAWILKTENKRLPRSDRGKSLQEALKIYEQKGIKLLEVLHPTGA